MATEVNLMNEDVTTTGGVVAQSIYPGSNPAHRMGFIGDALFRRTESTDENGSGGGTFRNMYGVKEPGNRKLGYENGYNRNGAGDATVPGGFVANSLVTKGDLLSDASGGYYIFTIDVNEANSGPTRFISLDDFQIFTGGSGIDTDSSGGLDPSEVTEAWGTAAMPQPSPGDASNLGNYATLIYNMDALEDSAVFIDYSSGTGSGTFDLYAFIPTTLFDAVGDDEMLYVFTEFGSYTGATSHDFQVEAGGEEVAVYTGEFLGGGITTNLPEPHTALLSALGGIFLLARRARS
jgi:hypothetical protein